MKKRPSNNLVYTNQHTGTDKVRAFKDIIQRGMYPEDPCHFSPAAMAMGERTFNAIKKSAGTNSELADLMIFYVECGSQFTLDYGDMDEDFYCALEDIFEEILNLIKEDAGHNLLDIYKDRLLKIAQVTDGMGWGYGDQIQDLLSEAFPDIL
jgi:hypothetical protein